MGGRNRKRGHSESSGVRLATILAVGTAVVFATFSKPTLAQQADWSGESGQTVSVANISLSSLMERIEALEYQVVRQSEELYDIKEIDIVTKPTITIFGRAFIDYWAFPSDSPLVNWVGSQWPDSTAAPPPTIGNPNSFIGFRRLRLGAKGQVSETMEYKLQLEFAQPDFTTLKDAYLGWLNLPWNDKFLIGNQKRPYGLAHLDSSRYMVFMERPLMIAAFSNGGSARRLGVQAYGYSQNERWNWRYGANLMQNISTLGRIESNNFEPELAGRIANTLWYDEMSGGRGYAHWGLSGAACFPNGGAEARFRTRPEAYSDTRWYDTGQITNGETYQLGGVEGLININRLSVVGEYMSVQMQRSGGASDLNFHGGYVYVAYFLTNDFTTWDRKRGILDRTYPNENFFVVRTEDGSRARGWGAWQIAGRYSHGDFNSGGIDGGIGNSFTFALNWWWNPYARMQFNYINGQISDRNTGTTGQNPLPAGTGTSGDYNILGTRFMVYW
ncbi:MAG: porin [Pirellulales bacterium]|jgi:phosphate-selective porin OprO/OprP|nr:porin [Pirellulales bacterium]HJN66482.1 porin [Pirellulales bacterium]